MVGEEGKVMGQQMSLAGSCLLQGLGCNHKGLRFEGSISEVRGFNFGFSNFQLRPLVS